MQILHALYILIFNRKNFTGTKKHSYNFYQIFQNTYFSVKTHRDTFT